MEHLKEIVDYGTLGILLLMSILVLGYSIERWFFFRTISLKRYQTKNAIERDVTKNLTIISLIGSNAPYVGLLGTVGASWLFFMR